MRHGPGLRRSLAVLALLAANGLSGCGLFDRGSTVQDAFEYLPADTYVVQFADRGAMAERLGLDDIDPRDVGDRDVEDYRDTLDDERETAVARTRITSYHQAMKDAPINEFDIRWEALATWGDPDEDRARGTATVWKVGDDLDFDALADDLRDKGYDKSGSGDLPIFGIAPTAVDDATSLIGDVYPPFMLNVLLDEDEQVVVVAVDPDSLADVADVISDDTDSLADSGDLDDLLDVADGDPEVAWLIGGGPAVCPDRGRTRSDTLDAYADLGRPAARALLITVDDDPRAVVALRYSDGDAAEADLEARRALIDDGVDLRSQLPFDELGDFEVERDGELLIIDEDFDGGPAQALETEIAFSGPGACTPAQE